MRSLLPLLSLASAARALYFFIDVTSPKCFFEELPKDTLVVGHYKAEEWDDHKQAWEVHDGISIYISVDVRLSNLQTIPTQPLTPSPYPGNLRQRPPRRLPARRLLGQVHLHLGRGGRPQDLLHALLQQRPLQLAVGDGAQRRHPPDARRGHRRDQRPRGRRQVQDGGPGHARARPERAAE